MEEIICYPDTVVSNIPITTSPLTNEEINSGYFYNGKEIILGREAGRPALVRNPTYFSQEKKIRAATLYCVFGNVEKVAEETDIPVKFIRLWKNEPWFIEVQKQVYIEQNEELSAKISDTLDKTLTHLVDRLDNGDVKYNFKTGKADRIPIDTKTLSSVFNTLSHHRTVVRGEPTSISANIGIDDRLKTLQTAFLKFSKAKDITPEEDE